MGRGVFQAALPVGGCGHSGHARPVLQPCLRTEWRGQRLLQTEQVQDPVPAHKKIQISTALIQATELTSMTLNILALTAVPSTAESALPEHWEECVPEECVRPQKLHWTGKESCWSASSPYFFPGMNTDTERLSRTENKDRKLTTVYSTAVRNLFEFCTWLNVIQFVLFKTAQISQHANAPSSE